MSGGADDKSLGHLSTSGSGWTSFGSGYSPFDELVTFPASFPVALSLELTNASISGLLFLGGGRDWRTSGVLRKPEVVFDAPSTTSLQTNSCLIFGVVESGSSFSVGGLSGGSRDDTHDRLSVGVMWSLMGGGTHPGPVSGFVRRRRREGRTCDDDDDDEADPDPGDLCSFVLVFTAAGTAQPLIAAASRRLAGDGCGC